MKFLPKIKPNKKIIKNILKMIVYTIIGLMTGIILFLNLAPTFGAAANGDSLDKIEISPNYYGKRFNNLEPTKMNTNNSENNNSMLDFFLPKKDKNPSKPLPSKKFNKINVKDNSYTWLGHSTILIKTENITIITDPLFNRASPIPIFGKPFKIENPISIEDLPEIDVVIISHDHYDHLDHKAIKELNSKVKMFFVPLGVKAHLQSWGIDENKIIEKDWYEDLDYNEIKFTLTPTRHFSGRGITNRDSTLWGSWVIKSKSQTIYFGGDSGYSKEFKKIGKNYGPFDIVFLENGAYNDAWSQIHMKPEETVQASIDLKAKVLFPIHWSKFDLSLHPWDEPIIRLTKEAEIQNVTTATPLIGETFTLKKLPQTKWWESLRE